MMNERQHVQGPAMNRRRVLGVAIGGSVAPATVAPRAHLQSRSHSVDPQSAAATHPPSPEARYARSETLVTVEWLRDRQDDPALVRVGFMPAEEFGKGRIPGSVQIDWPELEVIDTSDASIESWQQGVQQLLGNLGIAADSTVVAYDNGTLLSARIWWILHYLGHGNVHILDGGLPAWHAANGEVETGAFENPAEGETYAGTPNADLLAQREEVLAMFEDPEVIVLDARTPEEFAEGHIPGAVNLNFPLNAAPEPPKFFKAAEELQTMYDKIGVTPDKRVIPYCASGVRSAVSTFALHLLGYEHVALYTGSWLEWREHPDTPKETGDAPATRSSVSSSYVL